ncbi:hypothetical protein ACR6C2_35160 [Streptomyces sp. INA 01156]
MPWRNVPLGHCGRGTFRGRDETRRLKAATVNRLPYPHAAQVLRLVRRAVRNGKAALDRACAFTSLDTLYEQAGQLAERMRRN